MSEVVGTVQQGLAGKYHPYPEYKDSGVEWLQLCPSSWETKALKYIVSCNDEVLSESTDPDMEFEYIDIGGVSSSEGITRTESMRFSGAPSRARRIVRQGDIIVSTVRTYLEAIAPISLEFDGKIASTGFAVLRPKFLLSGFAQYALRARHFIDSVVARSTGVSYPAINPSELIDIKIVVPSLKEQQTIAAFLDYETARIDRLIAQQQRLIELLKEKRQAVISHAVRTRPSEGHIKLAYAINLLTGYPFPSSGFKSTKDTHIPLLRGANVGVDQIKWDDVVYWDSEDGSHLDDYYLECGDIVFGMDRPWISSGARVAEITQHDTPCLLLQRVARIRAKANHFQPYIKLCLSSNEFRNYVEADLTGVSVPHISPDQIKGFLIRNLPYDEQVSITKEVLKALEKLNAVEKVAFNAIELLQERRTALISAAVTGKIDLRGWTPPAGEVAA